MMGWYHDGVGWGGWLLMILMMVLFWGLVVAAVVGLFRFGSQAAGPTPRELLDERLARGDLTFEEYDVLRRALLDGRRGGVVGRR